MTKEEEKYKIKHKIKALLLKTTDNGATKEEMESALAKANQLMLQYFVTENELKDAYISEKCQLGSVDMVKTGYNMNLFLANLSVLFDCQHYWSPYYKKLYFFGFEQDTELCIYFYKVITQTCLREKDLYLKSESYLSVKRQGYASKTLAASFIKGFLVEIAIKMNKMYKERASQLSEEVGLMVLNKKKRVENEFAKLNKKPNIHKVDIRAEKQAFEQGLDSGKKVDLAYGIESGLKENLFLIN